LRRHLRYLASLGGSIGWGLMTRNRQIRKALELLAPLSSDRSECKHDIILALDRVEHRSAAERSFRVAGSKKGKAGVLRYSAALRRLRQAYGSLDPAIRPWFSLGETAYVADRATIIDRELERAEMFLPRPPPAPRRYASRNKAAVAAAHDLLRWWGHKAAVTRKGKWAQLAKILVGDQALDLFDHLRAFKSSPGPSVEKVRGVGKILYRTRRRYPDTK
jgi:hypothetical protein